MALQINSIFAEQYELLEQIGIGGFAEVWKAKYLKSDTIVALKIYSRLDSEGLSIFRDEFNIVYNLSHSNLLIPSHFDTFEERPFLVMKYCPNGTALSNAGSFSENDIARLIRDIASGLNYLHSQNPPVIHHDIKPDNFLIDGNGTFLLSDFGISSRMRRTLTKSIAISRKTIEKGKAGQGDSGVTPAAYRGPELFDRDAERRRPVKANDIFALGVSIYELITEEFPFGEFGGVMMTQGVEAPDLPKTYSVGLNNLMRLCLEKETWDRPTADDLCKYASEYLADGAWNVPESRSAIPSVPKAKKKKKSVPFPKKKLLIPFGIIAFVVALSSGGYYFFQNNLKAQFEQAMNSGMDAMSSHDFASARLSFLNAQGLIDNEEIQQKIHEATDSLNRKYESHLISGDQYLIDEDFNEAQSEYNLALDVKPGDEVVTQKLREVDEMVDSLYQAALADGKRLVSDNQFEEAVPPLQRAIVLKPEEEEAQTILDEINSQVNQGYSESMDAGERYLANSNYSAAKSEFSKALGFKPGDAAAQAKLDEISRSWRIYSNLRFRRQPDNSIRIRSVEVTPTETIVNMQFYGVSSSDNLSLYGPRNSSSAFYIEANETEYQLKRARGISFGLQRNISGTKNFSLIFEPIPMNLRTINIIERNNGIDEQTNYWKFVGVSLR